jgi:hypothetical protein
MSRILYGFVFKLFPTRYSLSEHAEYKGMNNSWTLIRSTFFFPFVNFVFIYQNFNVASFEIFFFYLSKSILYRFCLHCDDNTRTCSSSPTTLPLDQPPCWGRNLHNPIYLVHLPQSHYFRVQRSSLAKHRQWYLLRSVRRLLVTANVVPSSPILVTLMKEALSFCETSVPTRAKQRNIPEDAIFR